MDNFFYKIRTDLHKIPEIALEEYKTSEYIRKFLKELDIEYTEIGTSTLAIFKGSENKWLGFRADIDALPITEVKESPYKSTIDGMMHACGHDGHTTILLALAKYIKNEINQGKNLKKSVMLIFQAGEEGKGGARFVAQSETFAEKDFEGIFGLHLSPELEEGIIGTSSGAMSYQNMNFDMEILGKGCHGAQPYKGIDVILVASKLIESYQSIISRNINPWEPVVLTIGSFKAGEVRNVIPEKANLLGTIRFTNVDLISFFHKRLEEINKGFEISYGVKINMDLKAFYPPVINSEDLYKRFRPLILEENFQDKAILSGSEDFSFYLQSEKNKEKGCFFLLGIKNEKKGYIHPLHTSDFDFDPSVLKIGFETFKKIWENLG